MKLIPSLFPPFQHDPENNKACVPGGEDGNYIMYARATSGDKKNNRQFSPCSLKSVREVGEAVNTLQFSVTGISFLTD